MRDDDRTLWRWNGKVMTPMPRFIRQAETEFEVGGIYRMNVQHDATARHSAWYHIELGKRFDSLPERFDGRWADVEEFRKWALIKCGFYDLKTIPCDSHDDALKVAATAKAADDYSIPKVVENTVLIATPKSQKTPKMGKVIFHASTEAVLALADELLGITEETTS